MIVPVEYNRGGNMKLKEKQKFSEDISFVKRLAEKRKNIQYSSIAIAYLWAVIIGLRATNRGRAGARFKGPPAPPDRPAIPVWQDVIRRWPP